MFVFADYSLPPVFRTFQMLHANTTIYLCRQWCPVVGPLQQYCNVIIKDRIQDKNVLIQPISSYSTYSSLGTKQGISENSGSQFQALKHKTIPIVRALNSAPVSPSQA